MSVVGAVTGVYCVNTDLNCCGLTCWLSLCDTSQGRKVDCATLFLSHARRVHCAPRLTVDEGGR